MIYIVVALGIEAKFFIRYFDMKRNNKFKKFQIFEGEKARLVITGVGMFKSTIATTYFLNSYEIEDDDILINFGLCGALDREKYEIGDVIIGHKITNSVTGKNWYPDMLLDSELTETTITTFPKVLDSNPQLYDGVIDMESAGVYEAGAMYFDNHQINIIKVISDFCDGKVENSEKILMDKSPKIAEYLEKRSEIKFYKQKEKLRNRDYVQKIIEKMRLSTTMLIEFLELLNYYELQGKSIENLLKEYENIEVTDKREGKKIYNEIKIKIIG